MKALYVLFSCILVLLFSALLSAQETYLVDLNKFYAEEINLAGFTLNTDQEVTIEVKIISPRRNYRTYHFTSAWMLNSDTRAVVWQLRDKEPEERDRYTAVYKEETKLPAGTYEVYYSTYPATYFDEDDHHWGSPGFFSGFFNMLFDEDEDNDRYKFFNDLYDELYCRVSGDGISLSAEQIEDKQKAFAAHAFISFSSVKDDAFEEQIFKVTEPVEVELYAQGEARRDGEYDFGVLLNLETRERVWQLTYRRSEYGGGANKNRVAHDIVELKPGIYKLMFVTDDSHSFRNWNEAPPFDPAFWGITLTPVSDAGRSALVKLSSSDELKSESVLSFEKVRDNEYLSRGFTLLKPLNLHIYALGEGRDGEMYDYGWIIDAKSKEKVWEMSYRDTESAGGDSKNRLFDNIVHFEPGNYIAYYITDDSHSYRDWNVSPPFDPAAWGLAIDVMDETYREGDFKPYEPEKDPAILAQLVRVDDHAHKKAPFTLKSDGLVHIYAIGEGSGGEMYDYAWIEDAKTGKVVWEMDYHKTERAGGARKNRIFDDNIQLKAGDYIVCYESDDSHSFNDWNDRPPRDPFSWGVTISKVEAEKR